MYRLSIVLCFVVIFSINLDAKTTSFSFTPPENPEIEENESDTLDDSSCLSELDALKSFISTSLWTLHISKKLTNSEAKECAEQVYVLSLDENERTSTSLARKIVSRLKNKKEDCFKDFVKTFYRSTENEKNGFGILAAKIEEKLINEGIRKNGNYQSIIKKVISDANSAQISFSEFSLTISELVNEYGITVTSYEGDSHSEYLSSGDKEEFAKKLVFIQKAFRLYGWLNDKFCTSRSKADIDQVYSDAERAFDDEEYSKALGLYQQVITMNAAYAAERGCYFKIGECHTRMAQYTEAIANYKKSIDVDKTIPYKRSSYHAGLRVYTYYLGESEENYLKGIEFTDYVYGKAKDSYIKMYCIWDKADIYTDKLRYLSGVTDSNLETYLLEGIAAFKKYQEEYVDAGQNKKPVKAQDSLARAYSDLGHIESLPDEERINYFVNAAEEKKKVPQMDPDYIYASDSYIYAADIYSKRIASELTHNFEDYEKYALKAIECHNLQLAKFPDDPDSEYSAYAIGEIYSRDLGMYYNPDNCGPIYNNEYLLKGIEANKKAIELYPNPEYAVRKKIAYDYIARSYTQLGKYYMGKDDLKLGELYFSEANTWYENLNTDFPDDYSIPYNNNSIADNYWEMSAAFARNGDTANQQKYGELAKLYFQKAIDGLEPDNPYRMYIRTKLADLIRDLGNYDQAISQYDELLSEFPDDEYVQTVCTLGKADCLFYKGEYDEAILLYKNVLAKPLNDHVRDYYYSCAYLGLGKCYQKKELYKDSLQHLATVMKIQHEYTPVNACYAYHDEIDENVKSAEKCVDSILVIAVDESIDVEAGMVEAHLATTLEYIDGNIVHPMSNEKYTWSMNTGNGTLTVDENSQGHNQALLETSQDDLSRIFIDITCEFDIDVYALGESKELVEYPRYRIKTLHSTGPIYDIVRKRDSEEENYLIYDVKGYPENNVVFPILKKEVRGSEIHINTECEPIACKAGSPFNLFVTLKPNKAYQYCEIIYEIGKDDQVLYSFPANFEIPVGSDEEKVLKIHETPDKLGVYDFNLKFRLYTEEPDKTREDSEVKYKNKLFVLYDHPKFPKNVEKWNLFYNLKEYHFVKRNINFACTWADEVEPEPEKIANVIHEKLVKIPFIGHEINWHSLKKVNRVKKQVYSPWNDVKNDGTFGKMQCQRSASLMVQTLNLLGIDNTYVRYIGAMKKNTDALVGQSNSVYKEVIEIVKPDTKSCECAIWIELNKDLKRKNFEWDAVCYVDFGDKNMCYNIAMQDNEVKDPYEKIILPENLGGKMIKAYKWVWMKGTIDDPIYEALPKEEDYIDAYKYWLVKEKPLNQQN